MQLVPGCVSFRRIRAEHRPQREDERIDADRGIVPIGLIAIPLVLMRVGEGTAIDVPGLVLVTGAAFGLVWSLVRGNPVAWDSTKVVARLAAGTLGAIPDRVGSRVTTQTDQTDQTSEATPGRSPAFGADGGE